MSQLPVIFQTSVDEMDTMDCLAGMDIVDQSNAGIERLEAELLNLPQVDCPLKHTFAPGVYMREVLMPAGAFIIGHEHKTEHINVIRTGRASVMMDGVIYQVKAGDTIVSQPGVRKVLYIHEEMSWATIHPTCETDLDRLEEALIVKSASYLEHLKDYNQLKAIIANPEDPNHESNSSH